MYIITVIMLGAVLGLGIANLWQQVNALSEAATYCYHKEQRLHFAQGVLAYAIACYSKDQAIQNAVLQFNRYEMVYEAPLLFPGNVSIQCSLTYELAAKEVIVTATVLVKGSQEIVRYSMRCPEKPF